jgi:enamine deaminase RidA (YjgF/YER057c/UK114 family)
MEEFMPKTIVAPPTVHKTTGYSHAIRSGSTLYISGQVAQDTNGKLVGPGDITLQGEQVYANLKAIIESCHGTMDNIVKLTTYVTDLAFRPALAGIRSRYFPTDPPAATFVVISSLAEPGYLVEVEAIAVLNGRQ